MLRSYLSWSLRQFYLLVFWPTQLDRELEDLNILLSQKSYRENYRYLHRMFPWILGLSIVLNLISGNLCDAFGLHFNWGSSWAGVCSAWRSACISSAWGQASE